MEGPQENRCVGCKTSLQPSKNCDLPQSPSGHSPHPPCKMTSPLPRRPITAQVRLQAQGLTAPWVPLGGVPLGAAPTPSWGPGNPANSGIGDTPRMASIWQGRHRAHGPSSSSRWQRPAPLFWNRRWSQCPGGSWSLPRSPHQAPGVTRALSRSASPSPPTSLRQSSIGSHRVPHMASSCRSSGRRSLHFVQSLPFQSGPEVLSSSWCSFTEVWICPRLWHLDLDVPPGCLRDHPPPMSYRLGGLLVPVPPHPLLQPPPTVNTPHHVLSQKPKCHCSLPRPPSAQWSLVRPPRPQAVDAEAGPVSQHTDTH